MADSGVIADVSTTFQSLLTNALSTLLPAPPPIAEVHDLQGTISTTPARMTIFLFEVIEDPTLSNRPPIRGVAAPNLTVQKAPLPLLLRFMLTPWSGDRMTDQRIIGRALQVLYDDAILSGPQLQGGLAGSGEALKIKLAPLTLEEQTRVWHAVQRPYRISLTYEVRVINLDSIRQEIRVPVRSRIVDVGAPARV
jgi:hypothetical protein